MRFIDQYRSYVINYNLGKDMVKRYVEAQGGTPANAAKRWQVFERLISSPRLPSGLKLVVRSWWLSYSNDDLRRDHPAGWA